MNDTKHHTETSPHTAKQDAKTSSVLKGPLAQKVIILTVVLLLIGLVLIALWYQERPQNEDDQVRAFLLEQLMGLDVLVDGSSVDGDVFLGGLETLQSDTLSPEDQNRLIDQLSSLP